jgi:Tfp pilus assembly protein PilV
MCRINHQRGFTLAEGLLASVVLAMTVVAVAGALSAAGGQSRELERRTALVSGAQELLEKVASLPVDAPVDGVVGYVQGNTDWRTYDDLNDFAGFEETFDAPLNGSTASPHMATMTRRVSVQRRSMPAGPVVVDGPFALVTIEVISDDGRTYVVNYLAARVNLVH